MEKSKIQLDLEHLAVEGIKLVGNEDLKKIVAARLDTDTGKVTIIAPYSADPREYMGVSYHPSSRAHELEDIRISPDTKAIMTLKFSVGNHSETYRIYRAFQDVDMYAGNAFRKEGEQFNILDIFKI
ncbi:hypothetical protein KW805_03235 [Candidatus Pacearchaeota archaeon]|nr:hypothetical protein [Candidatus Pacearchaeota archaeon]